MKKKIKDLTFEEIISIHNLSFCNECPLKDNNGDCIRTGITYNFNTEFLEKEIEIAGTPLLECIKEWNEKGFNVDVYALEIVIHNCYIEFTIDLEDKKLFMEGEYNSFPYDVVHLLAKTLKALEEMKDD